tara:strand:+ start:279 stop:503 length:225 start_codon:yes stop_codon:yes gene_type:complete
MDYGFKIMGKTFIYSGTTHLIFSDNGLIKEHTDYCDFCGPTFGPVPILGSFLRWLMRDLYLEFDYIKVNNLAIV